LSAAALGKTLALLDAASKRHLLALLLIAASPCSERAAGLFVS
jgi:hypothetical protein